MAFSGSETTRFSMSALYTRVAGSFASKAIEGAPSGRIMSSIAHSGGLASKGGIAGTGGGLAG